MKLHNKAKHPFQHSYFDEAKNLHIVEINAGEIKEIDNKIAKIWLKTGEVVEFVAPEDMKAKEEALTKEIEKLKAENAQLKGNDKKDLDLDALKAEADELGITYARNIGAEKLLAKINDHKANN